MSWSTIRKATDEDNARLLAAAERFCDRHAIEYGFEYRDALDAVAQETTPSYGCSEADEDRAKRLGRLWTRIVRRTLDSQNADGIAYGYVGCHVD